MKLRTLAPAILLTALFQPGCMSAYIKSIGGDTERVYTRIFFTDFNTAWQSVLDSLKQSPLDTANREAGYIQTRWEENTNVRKFAESFGAGRTFFEAKYRFRVTVAPGFYNGKRSVKVAVQKDQVVKRDALEGFRPEPTDAIEEKTLLYRIGRIIYMRTEIERLDEEKTAKELKAADDELNKL